MKSKLFYIAIALIAIILVLFSVSSIKKSEAIMANVESQKTAISFQRPVQIKALHVSEGQHVKKGQILLEVERPDLVLDREKLENEKLRENGEKKKLVADFDSRSRLLDIEVNGKVERLQSQLEQLRAEIRYEKNNYANILSLAGGDTSRVAPRIEEKEIQVSSLQNEIKRLQEYAASEKRRYRLLLQEDLSAIDLRLQIIDKELENLALEESTLKRVAPFDGTIGNVNSQLLELVPPYETIISLFEEKPSMIKAHLNLESGEKVSVGQVVKVESASREYSTEGEVVEIGSRIVSYRDPTLPVTAPDMFGREIFIKIPTENSFLYGEQVLVFVSSN